MRTKIEKCDYAGTWIATFADGNSQSFKTREEARNALRARRPLTIESTAKAYEAAEAEHTGK